MAESQNELWARLHENEHRNSEQRFMDKLLEVLERIEAKLEALAKKKEA